MDFGQRLLFKDIEDSLGDSGFSFHHIASDRAGTRMGELTTSNELDAEKIQILMITVKKAKLCR